MRERRFTIVSIGEALYDIFPQREVVSGAPLNTVAHVQQLGQDFDAEGVLVSRVGQDGLGARLIESLHERGLTTEVLQTDPDYPTGRVYVDLEKDGSYSYEIMEDVAWDVIQYDFDLEDLARQCHAISFGSLAQRTGQSRNTIYRFLDEARRTIKLFDLNLQQKLDDRQILERSCERATMVKVSHDTLPVLLRGLHLRPDGDGLAAGCEALKTAFDLEWVIVTRGSLGTAILSPDGFVEGDAASYEHEEEANPTGIEDSITAAILIGKVLQRPVKQVADYASHVGAYVASKQTSTPQLPGEIKNMIA